MLSFADAYTFIEKTKQTKMNCVDRTSPGAWSGAEVSHAHRPDHFKIACYGPELTSITNDNLLPEAICCFYKL